MKLRNNNWTLLISLNTNYDYAVVLHRKRVEGCKSWQTRRRVSEKMLRRRTAVLLDDCLQGWKHCE